MRAVAAAWAPMVASAPWLGSREACLGSREARAVAAAAAGQSALAVLARERKGSGAAGARARVALGQAAVAAMAPAWQVEAEVVARVAAWMVARAALVDMMVACGSLEGGGAVGMVKPGAAATGTPQALRAAGGRALGPSAMEVAEGRALAGVGLVVEAATDWGAVVTAAPRACPVAAMEGRAHLVGGVAVAMAAAAAAHLGRVAAASALASTETAGAVEGARACRVLVAVEAAAQAMTESVAAVARGPGVMVGRAPQVDAAAEALAQGAWAAAAAAAMAPEIQAMAVAVAAAPGAGAKAPVGWGTAAAAGWAAVGKVPVMAMVVALMAAALLGGQTAEAVPVKAAAEMAVAETGAGPRAAPVAAMVGRVPLANAVEAEEATMARAAVVMELEAMAMQKVAEGTAQAATGMVVVGALAMVAAATKA